MRKVLVVNHDRARGQGRGNLAEAGASPLHDLAYQAGRHLAGAGDELRLSISRYRRDHGKAIPAHVLAQQRNPSRCNDHRRSEGCTALMGHGELGDSRSPGRVPAPHLPTHRTFAQGLNRREAQRALCATSPHVWGTGVGIFASGNPAGATLAGGRRKATIGKGALGEAAQYLMVCPSWLLMKPGHKRNVSIVYRCGKSDANSDLGPLRSRS